LQTTLHKLKNFPGNACGLPLQREGNWGGEVKNITGGEEAGEKGQKGETEGNEIEEREGHGR
jgi:hypothetical protein